MRAWGLYAFMLAWAAALCAAADLRGARDDRGAFADKHASLLRLASVALADALTVEDALLPEAWVRRLAGEDGARYAALLDEEGRALFSAGDAPSGLPPLREDADAGVSVVELPGSPAVFDLSARLFVRGARQGAVRWGVAAAAPAERRKERRKALAASWLWAAAVGGGAAYFLQRRSAA